MSTRLTTLTTTEFAKSGNNLEYVVEGLAIASPTILLDVAESGVLLIKEEFNHSGGTVTMLFNHDFGNAWPLRLLVFVGFVFTVNKHDDVGVLLDGT